MSEERWKNGKPKKYFTDWRSSERQHARFLNQRRLQNMWQQAFNEAFERRSREVRSKDRAIYLAEHDADDFMFTYGDDKYHEQKEGS